MKKLLIILLCLPLFFGCFTDKRDKLTILKEEVIGKNIKELYGKKKILMGTSDLENYHVYFINRDFTVKSNKKSGYVIDVCLGEKCFPRPKIEHKTKKEKKPFIIGIWKYDNNLSKGNVKIFIKNKVYYYSITFDKDNSVITKQLNKINGRRYEVVGEDEYIILKEDESTVNYDIGDLEFWDKKDLILKCKRIN